MRTNRDAELDNLCLIFVRDSKMRVTTRHRVLEQAIIERFTYYHRYYERRKMKFELVNCFNIEKMDRNRHYMMGVGFAATVCRLADMVGCPWEIHHVDGQRIDHPLRMEPLKMVIPRAEWNSMRSWQPAAIKMVRSYRRGRFSVSTGSGKSWLIRRLCAYLKGYRILIIARGRENLGDLYNKILSDGTDVQYVDGSRGNDPYARVICCTTGSLGKVLHIRFDLVLGDEIHEHAAEGVVPSLFKLSTERMFGFSANVEDRSDNADMWCESIYGPVLLYRTYQQNVAANDVCQIKVRTLQMLAGPDCKPQTPADRDRIQLWSNAIRNRAFIDVARYYMGKGKQVLLLTNTSEHSLWIRKLMPDVPVVFRDPTKERLGDFMAMGLIQDGDDFSSDRNKRMANLFAERKIQCIIANQLWRQGKDFPSLDVLCRLDATTTPIPCTQASGRLSRPFPGKAFGILVDSDDKFDSSRADASATRHTFYRRQGWEKFDGLID